MEIKEMKMTGNLSYREALERVSRPAEIKGTRLVRVPHAGQPPHAIFQELTLIRMRLHQNRLEKPEVVESRKV